MKITEQILKEMIIKQLNEATLKDWLLGLATFGTAANIAVGGAALLDKMSEDAVESGVQELQRIEKEQGPEAVEDLRSQSPQGNETINAIWDQYDSLRAEGGYTDEPSPADSWNENRTRLEHLIVEELKKVLEERTEIGSSGNPVEHLHKLVSTNAYSDLNQIATYVANRIYASNVQQDRQGFIQAIRQAIPQLKELQGDLGQAAAAYAQSLKGVSAKWEAALEAINTSLDAGAQAADTAANPLAAAKDRMRQAYANREQDPEEYEAARQAYRAARGR
tara:strand:+ start:305 stop:1138 length:834 start_codon:yes stop_codon:yes gene_type:complete